jgi:hypothetical protein
MSLLSTAIRRLSSMVSAALVVAAALVVGNGSPGRLSPDWERRLAAFANVLTRDLGANHRAVSAPYGRWSHYEVELALMQCMGILARVRAEVIPVAPIADGACGTPAPVLLKRFEGKPNIEFDPPLLLNCPMVDALHGWLEAKVQVTAQKLLGSPVARIVGSSYSCRTAYFRADTRLSQHSFANAIDIPLLVLANGTQIHIAKFWGPTHRDLKETTRAKIVSGTREKDGQAPTRSTAKRSQDAQTSKAKIVKKASAAAEEQNFQQPAPSTSSSPQAKFLRSIHAEACGLFSTVLGPEANEAHRHHLHLDLQERGVVKACQ